MSNADNNKLAKYSPRRAARVHEETEPEILTCYDNHFVILSVVTV